MLKKLINKLKDYIKKNSKIRYQTLLPKDDIIDDSKDIIDYAVKKKKVNNIAITGGYSTGKSSLINSYFKNKKHVKIISLATFKEHKNNENLKKDNAKKIVLYRKRNNVVIQEVEKTIVEKLYYSSYIKKVDTRKILNVSISGLIDYVFFILIHNTIIDLLIRIDCISRWLSIFVLPILIYIIIYFIVSKISEFTSIKLKLGEIEIDTKVEKRNILNENLDMIIKIIKKAKYKYIIFEDLDRFECPEIFEHLRDLNITINSALSKPVKFIYAVKDDMFKDENRTKFFDMIIPVVPYVSYENSGEELLKIINDEYHLEKELPEQFVMSITAYISDMRILKNALNEYMIYKKKLATEKLSPNTSFYKNLFAMMIYKNTCSKDFALLQKKQGQVYNFFNNIEEHRKTKISEIEKAEEDYKLQQKKINNTIMYEKQYFIDVLIVNIKRTITYRNYNGKNRRHIIY